ncbi:DNA primase [bacterium]|nr:DNA primase [bacterium]
MAGRIPDDVIENVKRAADIADIVSRYVELKKAGRTFKALCPFHQEKTPSFTVNPGRQIFKCFGCGKGGDVFSFVAEHEHVDFAESVRIVAGIVGVTIPEQRGGQGGPSKETKTRLYQLQAWAAAFFVRCLNERPEGEAARQYLAGRGFDKQTLDAWSVGYAPDSWDALNRAASQAGYTESELLASGLVSRKEGSSHYYDRFRNRVMFPIWDLQGREIGFGARALGDDEVKYLNSPETPLFHKGRTLYGLDKARDAVETARRIVVTEGYTDALMCHQQGVPLAVATLGTALTREHVRELRRFADTVVLVFDADQAGENAVDRSLEVFADSDLDVRVVTVAEGMDPCEFLLEHGAAAFLKLIEGAPGIFETKLGFASRRFGTDTVSGRARALDDVLASIVLVSNAAKADLLLQEVAAHLGVDVAAARRRLHERQSRARTPKAARREVRSEVPLDPVERGVVEAVIAASELVPCVLDRVSLDDFADDRVRRILQECIDLYDCEGEITIAALTARLQDPELASLLADIASDEVDSATWEHWLQDCLCRIEERKHHAQERGLRTRATQDAQDYDRDALAAIYEHHRRRAGDTDDPEPDSE